MTDNLRRSPLAHRAPLADPSDRITLSERPHMGVLALRGDANKVSAAVKSATGLALPTIAGTCAETDDNAAIWISPDEWGIVVRPGTELEVLGKLKDGLEGIHSQVVNVSDYYTAIAIGGSESRNVLAKITMVDLHPNEFSKGNAIASLFGHAGAWLQMVEDEDSGGPAFALYVRRSMADYLWCLLAEAGREFGLSRETPIGQVKLHLPHFEAAH